MQKFRNVLYIIYTWNTYTKIIYIKLKYSSELLYMTRIINSLKYHDSHNIVLKVKLKFIARQWIASLSGLYINVYRSRDVVTPRKDTATTLFSYFLYFISMGGRRRQAASSVRDRESRWTKWYVKWRLHRLNPESFTWMTTIGTSTITMRFTTWNTIPGSWAMISCGTK